MKLQRDGKKIEERRSCLRDDASYWLTKEATYRRRNQALRGTNAFDSSRSASPLLNRALTSEKMLTKTQAVLQNYRQEDRDGSGDRYNEAS